MDEIFLGIVLDRVAHSPPRPNELEQLCATPIRTKLGVAQAADDTSTDGAGPSNPGVAVNQHPPSPTQFATQVVDQRPEAVVEFRP